MKKDTSGTGRIGEDVAVEFLRRKGFSIIERNFRRPWGEIDIIAKKAGVVRFVEVKSVSRKTCGILSHPVSDFRPEEQVHRGKLRKVARTAELYMDRFPGQEFQIDVVAVFLDFGSRKARCRLLEGVSLDS